MALLETMQEIQDRREKTLNRRQNRLAQGETVNKMPISREELRLAMANMDRIFKEGRAEALSRQEQRNRVAEAVARMQQEEAMAKQGQSQMQQGQPQMQQGQPQMQQAQSPLMGQMGAMMSQGAMGGMSANQPQAQPQQQPQAPQGLLGMPR